MPAQTLTAEQAARLETAITNAKAPGVCSYMEGCVIGQLLKLHGVEVSTGLDYVPVLALMGRDASVWRVLQYYPHTLLGQLQGKWDSLSGDTADMRRQAMRLLVAEHLPENGGC